MSTKIWTTPRTTFRNKTVISEPKSDAEGLKSEREEVLAIHFFGSQYIAFEQK